ncbi:SMI1/KNR4 family protein [Bremerella cremea]|uniref:SMI1/KNR4 family protein n=2 Tax=Bremerella cremea TaxID=1031537 RepID=A0A368KQT8_9BACT|nr:SMI1/KNR4 family protein [Bremerella cremea]
MPEFYLFDDYPRFIGFRFPASYLQLVRDGLPDIEPWGWLAPYKRNSIFWADTLKEQFPNRELVPFAKDGGSDDVACFDGADTSGDPRVLYIHSFCSPGFESRGVAKNFTEWLEQIEKIAKEFKATENE